VAFSDFDRDLYIELLRKYFIRFHVDKAGYALMPDHTQQVLIPGLASSSAKGVGRLHNDFARRHQIQRGQNGASTGTRGFRPASGGSDGQIILPSEKGLQTRLKKQNSFEVRAHIGEIPGA
jgi:hypothetical protein